VYKVGICGYHAEGATAEATAYGGQEIKTRSLTSELINVLGADKLIIVDTFNWRKRTYRLLWECLNLSRKCENIIILPAQNGVRVFVPLFLLLNIIFHRKLHYVVIGGWLPDLLSKNHRLKNRISQFDGIYVETKTMVESLQKMGLKNVKYLPNFKRLDILDEKELIYSINEPYKLCTFSRVMKEKGIEDAIEAVKKINNFFGREVYTLDIYGQIDEKYREKFEELRKKFPEYISYKGIVNFADSVKILKNYFALLFPTYYEGEGFAGTILDAYASGVPVIATNWKYNSEIIHDKSDGLIYDYRNKEALQEVLFAIQKKPSIILDMKKKCLKRAQEYLPEIVIGEFIKYL
jgi:glycosyltransferase involved in cell wall biosynthesis